jgi:hypothetical protein
MDIVYGQGSRDQALAAVGRLLEFLAQAGETNLTELGEGERRAWSQRVCAAVALLAASLPVSQEAAAIVNPQATSQDRYKAIMRAVIAGFGFDPETAETLCSPPWLN